jgi:hypothetical protein
LYRSRSTAPADAPDIHLLLFFAFRLNCSIDRVSATSVT